MKKISTLFVIDRNTDLAINEIREENKWIFDENFKATVKFDGSSCMIKNGILFKRWNRKLNKKAAKIVAKAKRNGLEVVIDEAMFKDLPDGAIGCNPIYDPITLHWPHWVPVGSGNEDAIHREAFDKLKEVIDGTFELVGTKVRCNPHGLNGHELFKHGNVTVILPDLSFDGIKNFLSNFNGEGLVFHNVDGKMCKLRMKDFGLEWNEEADPREKKVKLVN